MAGTLSTTMPGLDSAIDKYRRAAARALGKKENPLSSTLRISTHLLELLCAFPMTLGSFVEQANNIQAMHQHSGASDRGLGFFANIVSVIAQPLQYIKNYFGISNDVEQNQTASLTHRFLHPSVIKEFTEALFSFRRIIFNLLPGVFIVPSEAHNPDDPSSRRASKISVNFFSTLSRLTSLPRYASSLLTASTLVLGNFSGFLGAFFGKQNLVKASRRFSFLTDLLNPFVANLSSLCSTARAFIDSRREGIDLNVAFGRYNINAINVFQGLLGSLLALPSLPGLISRLVKQLEGENLELIVKDFAQIAASAIKRFQGRSDPTLQARIERLTLQYSEPVLTSLIKFIRNLDRNYLKNFLENFKPRTNVGAEEDSHDRQPQSYEKSLIQDQYLFNFLPKDGLWGHIYDCIRPIQSLLMLLPNAFPPLNDSYLTDNSRSFFRKIDRLLGISSTILSLPNFLVYSLSTRIPQLILKYFEMRQSYAMNLGQSYDANEHLQKFLDNCRKLPFLSFMAGMMDKLNLDSNHFVDPRQMQVKITELDKLARNQEPNVKASELIGAVRIGLRTLLLTRFTKPLFYAERGEDGLTAEERSSKSIYDWLGTIQEGLNRLPFIGLIGGNLLSMIRNLYYVEPPKKRFNPAPTNGMAA